MFKTFEILTLRSHSRKELDVSSVEPGADGRLRTVQHNMVSVTQGSRRPLKLVVTVREQGGPPRARRAAERDSAPRAH